jgi:hypothetical protein
MSKVTKITTTGKELDKKKLFELLKDVKPNLDFNDKLRVKDAVDGLIMSMLFGNSESIIEIVGRLELIKRNVYEFIESKEFDKWKNKVEESIIKEAIKKSETEAG